MLSLCIEHIYAYVTMRVVNFSRYIIVYMYIINIGK